MILQGLRFLTLSYYDFSGQEKIGHLIIFDGAAPYLLTAFKKMYQMHYPLESVGHENPKTNELTAAFNCREITGGNIFSVHAYGLAIDINVSRNPYLGEFHQDAAGNMSGVLIPFTPTSYSYLNRAIARPGMNEKIVKIMAESSFTVWGGEWQDRMDYQHFQVPDNAAINMAYLDRNSAEQFMRLVARYPESAKKMTNDMRWEYLYQLYPKNYMQVLEQYFPLLSTGDEDKVLHLIYQRLSSVQTNGAKLRNSE